jgi:hypothetical protein
MLQLYVAKDSEVAAAPGLYRHTAPHIQHSKPNILVLHYGLLITDTKRKYG